MPANNPTKTWSDLDLSFQAHPVTGDVTKSVGNMAVINALRYLLQTNHFEVPFNPSQGANITKLLFENITPLTAAALQKEITNTINNYEKRASIVSLDVTADIAHNGFQVDLVVMIVNQADPVSVSMFLQRIQ